MLFYCLFLVLIAIKKHKIHYQNERRIETLQDLTGIYYLAQMSERGIFMFLSALAFLALGVLPFGYKRWLRYREFKNIRKDILKWTNGNDLGFTYERYKKNRAGFVISYAYPILSLIPATICSLSSMSVSNPTHDDIKFSIIFISCSAIFHLMVMFKDFLKRNKEPKIDLQDVLSRSDLWYMTGKNETLENSVFLHRLSKNRNENSLLLVKNKDYLKELNQIPYIVLELRKLEESLSYLKKTKQSFSESDFESKKEKLTKGLVKFRELLQSGIHSTLIAIGKEKTLEQEKQENLYSEILMNEMLEEKKEKPSYFLPAPILELQHVIETSIDENVKKEAQDALDIANKLFYESKKRKEDFQKEFVRMNQKAVIDTALQEMHKY